MNGREFLRTIIVGKIAKNAGKYAANLNADTRLSDVVE